MDPLVILILAMVCLGLSQVSMSYAIQRAERNARSLGNVVYHLARAKGWIESDDGETANVKIPDTH